MRTPEMRCSVVRVATAVLFGCLLTPGYALLLAQADTRTAESLLAIPVWINHQLPHSEPWSEHLARWREAGYAIFDALLVATGTVAALALMPSNVRLLPGFMALFVPSLFVIVFGWLGIPGRPLAVLLLAPLGALIAAGAWAHVVGGHRRTAADRRSLMAFALAATAALAIFARDVHYYLFWLSTSLAFAASLMILVLWSVRGVPDSRHAA
jgi:hypothetical protein